MQSDGTRWPFEATHPGVAISLHKPIWTGATYSPHRRLKVSYKSLNGLMKILAFHMREGNSKMKPVRVSRILVSVKGIFLKYFLVI